MLHYQSCVSCPALIWLEAVASLKIFCNTVAAGYRAAFTLIVSTCEPVIPLADTDEQCQSCQDRLGKRKINPAQDGPVIRTIELCGFSQFCRDRCEVTSQQDEVVKSCISQG